MIPVSIRTGEEEDPWTNRVSAIFSPIPTDLADPAERVTEVGKEMAEGKHRFDLLPADLITDIASLAPGRLALQAARLATNPRVAESVPQPANLVISNVPGPREKLRMGKAVVRHYVPVSTVIDGQGLNITVQTDRKVLDLSHHACRELVPDLDQQADLHQDESAVHEKLAAEASTGE